MNWLRWLAVTALTLLIASCSLAPKKKPRAEAPSDAKQQVAKAQVELAAGAEAKAVRRFKWVINKFPNSDAADDATIQLARIYFKHQKFDLAYTTYMSLVESDVFTANEAEALLGASRCLHKMGRLDESLALSARGLKIPGLSDAFKLELYRHRYAVLVTTGDRLDALRALAFIYAKDPNPEAKSSAQARASEVVTQYLTESDLEKIVGDEEFGFVRAQAAFRLGMFRLQKKKYDDARSFFARAAEWGQGTPYQSRAESYVQQIDSRRRVDADTIGAVLPLTGRYSTVAYKTLNGLRLGLGITGPDRSSFRLAVVDSEGSPDQARQSVERLVLEDSAIAIVGSLLSRTAATVAAKADELGVPSIALSQKAGLTEIGPYIFRNAVTSEMQVKELVRLAMEDLKLKRFAILYPNDPYGVEYANLFWDEVLARGGVIAGAQVYNPKETDFRGPVKRLVGTFYVEDRRTEYRSRVTEWFKKQKRVSARRSPPDDLLPPIVDFDAIFIPDTPRAVGQIAPMLAYQGVTNIRMLGTNVWNSSELIRRGQQNVENAVFVDSNLINDPAFRSSKFFKDFKEAYGEEPGIFESQGYETGLLLRRLIENGERSRVGLASALNNIREFKGITGPMTMNANRELVRPLTPFVVKQNSITAWSPELENDSAEPSQKKPVRR